MTGLTMACRPGLLRGGRSLRDVYTGFAQGLPLVGAKILDRDQREAHGEAPIRVTK